VSLTTPFTELVGCRVPIQLAGMGGASSPELAAAVTNAGGLGMLSGITDVEVDASPVGVNFLAPFLDRSAVEQAAGWARLVEVFYGDPDPALVGLIHASGALAGWQVGSVDEAKAAVDAGCDVVVAQGVEAGGHVRGTVPLLPLLDGVLDAVGVPVVAAGGIGCARAMAGALAAGASAVRVGTRFVATHEANAHPEYQQALVDARAGDTVLTECFSLFWEHAPHRVLRAAVEAAEAFDGGMVGEGVPRFSAQPPERATTGTVAAMALYAGESVGAVRAVVPAADVVRELSEGAEALLRAWASG